MHHPTVYKQKGMFAAWPANNGAWSWDGREILVGFTVGAFKEQAGHNIETPYRSILARSFDQGETWTAFEPKGFVGSGLEARELTGCIDFTDPGLAVRVEGEGYHGSARPEGAFHVSRDRGSSWSGPFPFGLHGSCPELEGLEITSRTDYVVEGPQACLFIMSGRGGHLPTDKVFCVRTSDGGHSFTFVSWVVPPSDPYRAVMPSTVICTSGELVSVVRRREPDTDDRCWIDAYSSVDGGRSWTFSGKVADTGGWNGNPPALARLDDGRLCCVFGQRDTCRMVARYSDDAGRTWGGDIVLRDDFQRDEYGDPDLGYPRLIRRADGLLIAVYYWATRGAPHQHIAATVWAPDGVE